MLLRSTTAALYLVAIFVVGTMPPSGAPSLGTDKLWHAVAFFLMVLVSNPAIKALGQRFEVLGKAPQLALFLYASAAGGALELVQAGLPYRSADWFDFAFDVLGAALGSMLLWGVSRWRLPARG